MNPENTILAVKRALAAGADGVEVDVRRCGTGELVVIHDETVDRISDATGRVADMSLSALRSLNVLETGRGVPTLADVLQRMPADCVLNIELKETGLAEDVVDMVADVDCEILVSSFETDILREVARVSDLPLAVLCRDGKDSLETARALDCRAIHPREESCDEDVVTAAHAAGLSVNAWTVQSQETADRLAAVGVDGLIADSPACCRD